MSPKFISADRNDSFAFLRGLDLQKLLVQTENYGIKIAVNAKKFVK